MRSNSLYWIVLFFVGLLARSAQAENGPLRIDSLKDCSSVHTGFFVYYPVESMPIIIERGERTQIQHRVFGKFYKIERIDWTASCSYSLRTIEVHDPLLQGEKQSPSTIEVTAIHENSYEYKELTNGKEETGTIQFARDLDSIKKKQLASPINQSVGDEDLLKACQTGRASEIQKLLNQGANPNVKDKNGFTCLMMQAVQGSLPAVKALVMANADVNAVQESCGCTAFLYAAHAGKAEVADYLARHGANISAQDKDGDNALIPPASHGYMRTVRLLLTLKIDRNHKNRAGKTALDSARENKQTEVVKLLEETP
jgi:hypothetical protein